MTRTIQCPPICIYEHHAARMTPCPRICNYGPLLARDQARDLPGFKDELTEEEQNQGKMLRERARKNQIMPPKVIPVIQVDTRLACCEKELQTLQERLSEGEEEKAERLWILLSNGPSKNYVLMDRGAS